MRTSQKAPRAGWPHNSSATFSKNPASPLPSSSSSSTTSRSTSISNVFCSVEVWWMLWQDRTKSLVYAGGQTLCRKETLCAEWMHALDTRAREGMRLVGWACAVYHQEGHMVQDLNSQWKAKEKKRTTKELASKASLYDHIRRKGSREDTRGRGRAALEAASTRRSELNRLKTTLRARFCWKRNFGYVGFPAFSWQGSG